MVYHFTGLNGARPVGGSDCKQFVGILRVAGSTALPTVYAQGNIVELPDETGRFTLKLDRPSVTDLVIHYALKGNAISGVVWIVMLHRFSY